MNRYITTAIDYPNAAPHMGHVLEKVLADVLVRWFRLKGDDVRFQIGTDEHGTKIQRTAEKEGITPKALVDKNVPLFQNLYSRLNISYDVFLRTSDEIRHYPTVVELWKRLHDAGVLEKRAYTGLYCSGCERFMTKRDLVDGKCPNHKAAPEKVTEENWFLKMSEYGDDLKNMLTNNWDGEEYRIVPQFRENETLSLLDQGLEDVSFSRPSSSLQWGIPVPLDDSQVMYVWCDALTNYISGIDIFGVNNESAVACDERAKRVEWWDDAKVIHVIGKDIARFHALIWPLMLKKSGVRLPDELLIHGFLTSEGEKMSKSVGNVIVPDEVLAKFNGNPDPLRFYLSHEIPVGRDGDFSWERFEKLYDSSLRNNLGNLLNRVLVLLNKEDGQLGSFGNDPDLLNNTWEDYSRRMDEYDLSIAVTLAIHVVINGNGYITKKEPWTLKGDEKINILTQLAEALRHVSLLLLPFVPDTAYRISKQLNVPYAGDMLKKDFVITEAMKQWGGAQNWKRVGDPEILFAPLE